MFDFELDSWITKETTFSILNEYQYFLVFYSPLVTFFTLMKATEIF